MNLAVKFFIASFSMHLPISASHEPRNQDQPSTQDQKEHGLPQNSPNRVTREPRNRQSNNLTKARCLLNSVFFITMIGGLFLTTQSSFTGNDLSQCMNQNTSSVACLTADKTVDMQHRCWDAQITMNATPINSTIEQHSCLCPVDGIDNSTALTAWALAHLLANNSSQTLGNASLCIRPNLKPCATANGCSDARQAFSRLKKSVPQIIHHAARPQRTIKHLLQQPRRNGKNRGK